MNIGSRFVAAVAVLGACVAAAFAPIRSGLVEFGGSQKTIFETGRAAEVVPLSAFSGEPALYGVAAASGLDGEITVLAGKAYVTQVRGDGYVMDHRVDHYATFAVWARVEAWTEEPVPPEVKGYVELQDFVKARARAAGIDAEQPFPFRLEGVPAEVKWHINVDRTAGRPVTPALFARSKANYLARNEPMEIVGFYSENHPGVFISAYAPAIPEGGTARNAMHVHIVSKDGKVAGHLDNVTLAPGMVLRLPKT